MGVLHGSFRKTLMLALKITKTSIFSIIGAVKGGILTVSPASMGAVRMGSKCHCSSIFVPSAGSLTLAIWLQGCCQRVAASLTCCLAPEGSKWHLVSLMFQLSFRLGLSPMLLPAIGRREWVGNKNFKKSEVKGRLPGTTGWRKSFGENPKAAIFSSTE